MLVADLRHYLDMPDTAPGPAHRLGEQLTRVVRAATAAPAGSPWTSALRCRRRPGRRACPGHLVVLRADLPAPIEWACSSCADQGTISGWEGSAFDLRRSGSTRNGEPGPEVMVSDEVVDTLRSVLLLDPDSERVVFSARGTHDGALLAGDEAALEELAGFVAAEANHEHNRRRQRRLDEAFDALNTAAELRY